MFRAPTAAVNSTLRQRSATFHDAKILAQSHLAERREGEAAKAGCTQVGALAAGLVAAHGERARLVGVVREVPVDAEDRWRSFLPHLHMGK